MELIIGPQVLFLDEPTTGLDAHTAASVMKLLKRYDNTYTGSQKELVTSSKSKLKTIALHNSIQALTLCSPLTRLLLIAKGNVRVVMGSAVHTSLLTKFFEPLCPFLHIPM